MGCKHSSCFPLKRRPVRTPCDNDSSLSHVTTVRGRGTTSYRSFMAHEELNPDSIVAEDGIRNCSFLCNRSTTTAADQTELPDVLGALASPEDLYEKLDENDNIVIKSHVPALEIPAGLDVYGYMKANFQWYTDATALIDGSSGKKFTFGEVSQFVRRVARGLERAGFRRGEVLCLLSHNVPECAIIFFAVAALHGVFSVLDPHLPEDDILWYLKTTNTRYVVSSAVCLQTIAKLSSSHRLKRVFVLGKHDWYPSFSTLMDDSGSGFTEITDTDKESAEDVIVYTASCDVTPNVSIVRLTQSNILAVWIQLRQPGGLHLSCEKDCALAVSPFSQTFGLLMGLCYPLLQGCTVVTLPHLEVKHVLNVIDRYKVTLLPVIPTWATLFSAHPLLKAAALRKVELVVYGAATLPDRVIHALSRRGFAGVKFIHGYEETASMLYVAEPEALGTGHDLGGSLAAGCDVRILDMDSGHPMGPHEQGEVCVRGPQVMLGYLEKSVDVGSVQDEDGWLHTGDAGWFDEFGKIYVRDRIADVIKFKNVKVSPREIECVILRHPGVGDVAVTYAVDCVYGQVPRAFVVLKSGYDDVSSAKVVKFANRYLPPAKYIRGGVVIVDDIPRSTNGKTLGVALQSVLQKP